MNREEIMELRTSVQKFVKMFGLFEKNITPCGTPLSVSQVIALQELEKEKTTIADLANKLSLERSSVSRLVDNLVKMGLINRVTNAENRREVQLSLTEKGEMASQNIREHSIHFYQNVMKDVPDEKQKIILEGLQLFVHSLSRVRGETQDES